MNQIVGLHEGSLDYRGPVAEIWMNVEASLNVMAHVQKPDFVFRRNGRVRLNLQGHQFSRLLAAEVRASAVVSWIHHVLR